MYCILGWERKTPVNVKCVKNSCAQLLTYGVSLPPPILISRHTKPEVLSRAEWTPHEGCLCPLWLWYRSLLTVQSWPTNSTMSPRRCWSKCTGNSDIREFFFLTMCLFPCFLGCVAYSWASCSSWFYLCAQCSMGVTLAQSQLPSERCGWILLEMSACTSSRRSKESAFSNLSSYIYMDLCISVQTLTQWHIYILTHTNKLAILVLIINFLFCV